MLVDVIETFVKNTPKGFVVGNAGETGLDVPDELIDALLTEGKIAALSPDAAEPDAPQPAAKAVAKPAAAKAPKPGKAPKPAASEPPAPTAPHALDAPPA